MADITKILIENFWQGLGTSRNHDINANETSLKNISSLFLYYWLRDYDSSVTLYNVVELSSNKTSRNVVQVETEMKKFIVVYPWHVLHKTLNLIISRCCLAE